MKHFNETLWLLAIGTLLILAAIAFFLWDGPAHSISASVAGAASGAEVVNEPIQPIPLHIDLDQNKVALGKRLFNERLLSGNNTISCSSCHNLSAGGADGLQYTVGINGQVN